MNNPNPFAQNNLDVGAVVEERTSVLAIVALVLSLICIIPGFGVLGAILAVIALIMIGGSNGRLGGRGLAIAALIIGLLVSTVWIGGFLVIQQGMTAFTKMFTGNVGTLLGAAEKGDYTTARAQLDPSVANSITDADFKRFVDGYSANLGKYKKTPQGMFELFGAYANVGPAMQGMHGQANQGLIPITVEFDNGWAVVVIQINQAGNPGPAGMPAPLNVEVMTTSNQSWKLYDPQAANPTAPTTPDAPKPGTP